MKVKKAELEFCRRFPKPSQLNHKRSLLIFDQVLLKHKNCRAWLERFPFRYGVSSGESLKDVQHFANHLEEIIKITSSISERPLQIICLGGGSVGDFSGFVASVLKRGVDFVQIPSTWLAAIDSAHGGKNALNVGQVKNQIGSFHFPVKVVLIQELLKSQPVERIDDALGEVFKIALIQGGELWQSVRGISKWGALPLWRLLPQLIQAKYRVVHKDPLESKGVRHLLNFGHTLGHVLEAELGLSHGRAVLIGLAFAVQWSQERGILRPRQLSQFGFLPNPTPWLRRLQQSEYLLSQDKKRVGGGKLRFIFLERPGRPIIQSVSLRDIIQEIKRQAL